MTAGSRTFRRAAVERQSTPDRLDELIVVAAPSAWLRGDALERVPRVPKVAGERRVRTPTVLQMEGVECGAAALAMVLAYYGRSVPLEELRTRCDVTRDGTKASNIVTVAREYGLRAKGFRKSPEALRHMEYPAILHWNFQHFVVLEGFERGRAYINDPALGRYSVDSDELDEAFTGVTLAFERTPEFVPAKAQRRLADFVRERLRGSESGVSLVLFASLALIVPALAVPWLTRAFVDRVLIQRAGETASTLILGALGVGVASALLTWLQRENLLRLERRIAMEGAREFLTHALRLPMEFFSQRAPADVAGRLRLNDRVGQLLSGEVAGAGLSVLTAVFYLVLMLRYDWRLSLVVVVIAAANAVALRLMASARREHSRRLVQDQSKQLGTAAESIGAIETVKATASETDVFARWSGYLAKSLASEQRLTLVTRRLGVVPSLLQSVAALAVLGLGGARVLSGEMTLGTLLAFQYLAASFIAPIGRLVTTGTLAQEADAMMGRLDDVMRYTPRTPPSSGEAEAAVSPRNSLSGAVSLSGVTFGYARLAPPLVSGITLDIAAGKRVAVVGRTGSGKSTLARLVCGLYEPWDGVVLFDGVPRRRLSCELLASSVALVEQDPVLFESSIHENVTLWNEAIDDASVAAAIRAAAIHDEIEARRGGRAAPVREGGMNLSGGQRQRIELARALAGRPSLLVLDEATSALDAATERAVMDNVRALGITCLIIAHRLSTVRDCDEIIVLRDGRIAERGTHDELVAAGGHYLELIQTA